MQESGDFSACRITTFNTSSLFTVNVEIYIIYRKDYFTYSIYSHDYIQQQLGITTFDQLDANFT